MKYLNQINAVLMLVGCVVVVYAFTVTYWQQGSEVPRIPLLPPPGNSTEGVGPTGSPLLRRSNTTTNAVVDRVVPQRAKRAPLRGGESVTSGSETGLQSTGPAENGTVETPEGPNVSRVGEKREAVTVSKQASEEVSSPAAARPTKRNQPRSESIAPRPQPPRPTGAAESEKRNESRSPSAPPVRSSMMGRGPQ